MLCENVQFSSTFAPILKADFFESQPSKLAYSMIYEYVINYGKELDQNGLLILANDFVTHKGYTSDVFNMIKEEVKTIFHTPINSEDFIRDKLTHFVKSKAFEHALIESVDLVKTDEKHGFERALRLIDNAVSIGDTGNRGFWFEDLKHLPDTYTKYYSKENMVMTGYPDYDTYIGGGMAPGELHVILGKPKSGKSTFGVNVGSNVLMSGKPVFHISLELKKDDVALKYASRLTGMTKDEILVQRTADYQKAIEGYMIYKPNLYIEYWTMKTINAMTIRSWISQIRAKTGKSPGLIIVDYEDLLKPTGGESDNMYTDSGGVYADLIGLGDYFKCPVLSFSQAKREAWKAFEDKNASRPLDSSDLSHSAMKAHHCTSIASLNFKENDVDGMLYLDISRRGESHKEIRIKRDYSRSIVKQQFGV